MTTALNISKTPANLDGHLNARTERHGDEKVGAVDLTFSGIIIGDQTLNVLMGDDQAHDLLFRSEVDPQLAGTLTDTLKIHPRFRSVKHLTLDDVFENAKVHIYTGRLRKAKLALVGVLKKIKLKPLQGGLTEFTCQFQTKPDSDDVATLFDVMNKDVEVEIIDAERVEEDEDQQELPMQHSQEEVEAAAVDEEEAMESAIGRQIRNAETKKRRGKK